MKEFCRSTSASLFALIFFISFEAHALDVAVVHSITGKAFYSHGGEIRTLRPGQGVPDFSEIMTEVGGQVTFSDYFDRRYHLSGSGHVRLMKRLIDLKSGYLWIQTLEPNGKSLIQTANSRVSYGHSEGIISFDPEAGKTQLLSIKGDFELTNSERDFASVLITEGKFSFVSNDYENGIPRVPTVLGYDSFKKVKTVFRDVEPLGDESRGNWASTMKEAAVARVNKVQKKPVAGASTVNPVMRLPASAQEPEVAKVNESPVGKFIYLKKEKFPEKRDFDLESYYDKTLKEVKQKPVKRKFKPSYTAKSNVEVNVFDPSPVKTAPKGRMPASIGSPKAAPMKVESSPTRVNLYGGSKFKNSLMKEYRRQMRHEKEVNRLIEDLKNYDQDYKADY